MDELFSSLQFLCKKVKLTIKIEAEVIQCRANGAGSCVFVPQLIQQHVWVMVRAELLVPQDHWRTRASVHALNIEYQVVCPSVLQVEVAFHIDVA